MKTTTINTDISDGKAAAEVIARTEIRYTHAIRIEAAVIMIWERYVITNDKIKIDLPSYQQQQQRWTADKVVLWVIERTWYIDRQVDAVRYTIKLIWKTTRHG